jgi:hypothetical protein
LTKDAVNAAAEKNPIRRKGNFSPTPPTVGQELKVVQSMSRSALVNDTYLGLSN